MAMYGEVRGADLGPAPNKTSASLPSHLATPFHHLPTAIPNKRDQNFRRVPSVLVPYSQLYYERSLTNERERSCPSFLT